MPTDSATSHGWTSLTISRASIANGLNGGTNDAMRPTSPPPPSSTTNAER